MFNYKEYSKYLYSLKFNNIEQYQRIFNDLDERNNWMKYITMKKLNKIIKTIYDKELDLDLDFFEMTGRNNEREDEKELSLIEIINKKSFKSGKWIIRNQEIILLDKDDNEIEYNKDREEQENWEYLEDDLVYKDTELKQSDDSKKGNKMIKNWVKLMKQNNIRVPQGRFEYYIRKLHNSSSVSERIILKELWDPNLHKIDKKYYLEGLIPFLSICLDKSVKETKELLNLLIDRYTQNNLDKYIVSDESKKRKNTENNNDKTDNKKYKQSCIDSFFNK